MQRRFTYTDTKRIEDEEKGIPARIRENDVTITRIMMWSTTKYYNSLHHIINLGKDAYIRTVAYMEVRCIAI